MKQRGAQHLYSQELIKMPEDPAVEDHATCQRSADKVNRVSSLKFVIVKSKRVLFCAGLGGTVFSDRGDGVSSSVRCLRAM